MLFFTSSSSRRQANRRLFGRSFRLAHGLAIVGHIVSMLVAPLFLAVAALRAIRRVVLYPLAVIVGLSLPLAGDPAAYRLPRMITAGRERFLTVPASVKCHINLWHSLMPARVRVSLGGSPLRAAPIQMCSWTPKTLTLFDFASRSWSEPRCPCSTACRRADASIDHRRRDDQVLR